MSDSFLRTTAVYDLTPDEAERIGLAVFRGYDGAIVVQIDTAEGTGHLRVNVNDAPVFDQDPEAPARIDYATLNRSL
jgi:hypothetical protein